MSDLLDLAQTIALVGAFLAAVHEFRERRHELSYANYLAGFSGYVESAKLLFERPELLALYDGELEYAALTSAQKARAHYCEWIIAHCETMWGARNHRWLPPEEWRYWRDWLCELHNVSSDFRWTWNWLKDGYDPPFVSEMEKLFSDLDRKPQPRATRNSGKRAS